MILSELLMHASRLVKEQEDLIQQHEARLKNQDDRIDRLEIENEDLRSQVNFLHSKEQGLEKSLTEVGNLFQNVANILTRT